MPTTRKVRGPIFRVVETLDHEDYSPGRAGEDFPSFAAAMNYGEAHVKGGFYVVKLEVQHVPLQ